MLVSRAIGVFMIPHKACWAVWRDCSCVSFIGRLNVHLSLWRRQRFVTPSVWELRGRSIFALRCLEAWERMYTVWSVRNGQGVLCKHPTTTDVRQVWAMFGRLHASGWFTERVMFYWGVLIQPPCDIHLYMLVSKMFHHCRCKLVLVKVVMPCEPVVNSEKASCIRPGVLALLVYFTQQYLWQSK